MRMGEIMRLYGITRKQWDGIRKSIKTTYRHGRQWRYCRESVIKVLGQPK